MLAVEISRCAFVSHRGADSRHDSPTEFGGRGGELGANWGADKHEQFKVLRWILFTSLPVSDDVQLLMYFSFPRRLIQFIDLGNGVRAKKYNISLHLLSLIDREEKLSFYRHGSSTRIDHPGQKNAKSFLLNVC